MQQKRGKNKSISMRVSAIVFVMLLVAAITTGVFGYLLYRQVSLKSYQQIVLGVAQTVSVYIDEASYEELTKTQEMNAYWQELKSYFDEVKLETGVKYLYALNNDVDGKIKFIVEGQVPDDDPAMICALGEVLPMGSYTPELFETLETGLAMEGSVHNTQAFGTMVSGYAPIKNASGEVIGAVGADLGVEMVLDEINGFGLSMIGIGVLISAVFGLILILYIDHTIEKPIEEIIDASAKLVADDLSAINVNDYQGATDEIGRLTESFQEVLEKTRKQDALTGTSSRSAGIRALEHAMEAQREGGSYCAAFIDVDNLKTINDEYGHLQGDNALQVVAKTLLDCVRDRDVVCRYGGDEFMIVFMQCEIAAASSAIERIKERLSDINESGRYPYIIDFSYGLIAIDASKHESVSLVVEEMDALMYQNKRNKHLKGLYR